MQVLFNSLNDDWPSYFLVGVLALVDAKTAAGALCLFWKDPIFICVPNLSEFQNVVLYFSYSSKVWWK
jgi:hypothetical protein